MLFLHPPPDRFCLSTILAAGGGGSKGLAAAPLQLLKAVDSWLNDYITWTQGLRTILQTCSETRNCYRRKQKTEVRANWPEPSLTLCSMWRSRLGQMRLGLSMRRRETGGDRDRHTPRIAPERPWRRGGRTSQLRRSVRRTGDINQTYLSGRVCQTPLATWPVPRLAQPRYFILACAHTRASERCLGRQPLSFQSSR